MINLVIHIQPSFVIFFFFQFLISKFDGKATLERKLAFEPSTKRQEGQYKHYPANEAHYSKLVHARGRPLVVQRHVLIVRDLLLA